MTVEFTQQDLDYLAKKIAEILKGEKEVKQNPFDKMNIRELVDEGYVSISVRLFNILSYFFKDFTMRDLASVRWKDFARVDGLGQRTYDELCSMFTKLGYTSGCKRLKYNRSAKNYYIEHYNY